MSQPVPDGSLLDWREIASTYGWKALLLGNGLSINVWDHFGYDSLYRESRQLGEAGVSAADQALFDALDTQNFERVLGALDTSIRVVGALGHESDFLLDRYASVQKALGEAVRAVHVPWPDVSAATLKKIKDELFQYERIFTTSYDLLLYWAMGHDGYGALVDCFWGTNCRFDADNVDVRDHAIPIYFLHGAMHLVVEGSGRTRKLTNSALSLLEQFGQLLPADPQARPLLVTEGSARDKLAAIEANSYLAHAFETLQSPYLEVPLVVFGCSLGAEDRHLTQAVSAHPDRPVAVSMLPESKSVLRAKQADVFGRIVADPLLFFDARTHPLGVADLAVPS